MKKIHIFVAGAKDLKQQRTALKALGNDINAEYDHSGNDTTLSIRTYENFGENQDEYNKFIQEKADLIIFVLEGKIGPYTEKEFFVAYQQLKQEKHPQIMVFLKEFTDQTPDILYIEGLLKGSINQFYVSYKNNEDLIAKAKERIKKFISQHQEKKSCKSFLKKYIKPIGAGMIGMFLIGCVILGQSLFKSPILLLTGGGSAANFIERYHPDFNLRDFDGGYYVHLPSSNAWLLLTEEVITPGEPTDRRYYPVCLSAEEATDSCFLTVTSKNSFIQKGSIVEVKIGYDTLSVCVKNADVFKQMIENFDKRMITSSELAHIIKTRKDIHVNVFTTSMGSGTRHTFEKLMEKEKYNLAKDTTLLFSEDSDLPTVNRDGSPYLLLDSKAYCMKKLYASDVKAGKAVNLTVVNEVDKSPVLKPVYLYFMAYNDDGGNDLTVPMPIIRMMKKLNFEWGKKLKNDKIRRYSTESIILKYDELPEIN